MKGSRPLPKKAWTEMDDEDTVYHGWTEHGGPDWHRMIAGLNVGSYVRMRDKAGKVRGLTVTKRLKAESLAYLKRYQRGARSNDDMRLDRGVRLGVPTFRGMANFGKGRF